MSKNKDTVVKLEVPEDYITPYKHNEIFIKNIMSYNLEPGHSLAIYTKYDLETSSEVITVLFTKEDITRFCNDICSNKYIVKWMVNETAKVKLDNATSISYNIIEKELNSKDINSSIYNFIRNIGIVLSRAQLMLKDCEPKDIEYPLSYISTTNKEGVTTNVLLEDLNMFSIILSNRIFQLENKVEVTDIDTDVKSIDLMGDVATIRLHLSLIGLYNFVMSALDNTTLTLARAQHNEKGMFVYTLNNNSFKRYTLGAFSYKDFVSVYDILNKIHKDKKQATVKTLVKHGNKHTCPSLVTKKMNLVPSADEESTYYLYCDKEVMYVTPKLKFQLAGTKWIVTNLYQELKNTVMPEYDKDAELDYELCNLSLYMYN